MAEQIVPLVVLGISRTIEELRRRIAVVGPSELPVLIQGESGCGKRFIARVVHERSGRAKGPFVVASSMALPDALIETELFGAVALSASGARITRPGFFQRADGGTLLLTDVSELSGPMQGMVLRAIESGSVRMVGAADESIVDVRVVATSDRELSRLTQQGVFRSDLYHRLSAFPLHVPPLRERRDDVAVLTRHFARVHAERLGRPVRPLSAEALDRLTEHEWPGNVRQLENVVQQAVLLAADGESIGVDALPLATDKAPAGHGRGYKELKAEVVHRFERDYAERLLTACEGNICRAARVAGLDRKGLWKLLQRHSIDAKQYHPRTNTGAGGPSNSSSGAGT